jgi:uncharacterized protein involved in response to NO
MIFGTVVAVIAGFLLTAVPNWTSTTRVSGMPLVGLVALYFAGRLALVLSDQLGHVVTGIVDVAFLPAVVLAVGKPIVESRNWRNTPVVAVLVGLALANTAIHVGRAGSDAAMLRAGTYSSVYLVVVMMIIISGRVVPAFTGNALRRAGVEASVSNRVIVGPLAIAFAVASMLSDLVLPGSDVALGLALVASPLLLIRQSGWEFRKTLDQPMLWVLHVGHAWLAIGFGCLGVSGLFGIGIGAAAIHAFTAGAMGTLMLGMMPRVSLGHSGRPIEATHAIVWMFVFAIAGAVVRVGGASGPPELYLPGILLGGALWTAAWVLYTFTCSKALFAESS